MKKAFFTLYSLIILLQPVLCQSVAARERKSASLKEMQARVVYFLNALPDSLRTKAAYAYDDEERFNWHFVPRPRKGACYKSMNGPQRQAAMEMVRSVLSEQGYAKTLAIMELETVLKELENRAPADHYRDPENYYFTIFGNPSGKEPWGWRIEGHHLSLNFSSVTKQVISSTPAFMGANPAIVPSGPQRGKQILKQEEELARSLMQTFTPAQLKEVIIADTAPQDIITGNSRKAILESSSGLSPAQMSPAQKKLFTQLLYLYLNNFKKQLAGDQMIKIKKEGVDKLRFAWAGSTERSKGHYYRIHGPTILIEYDNTQTDANHVHTVVRDLTNDFAEDALRKHYEQHSHSK